MKNVLRALLYFVAATAALSAYAQVPNDPPPEQSVRDMVGRWLTESGNLEVEIAPCGDALCGTVVRVIANRSMSNPDAVMAPVDSRPALGMTILSDLARSADGEWQGRIYNRENGKTYRCLMSLAAPDHLKIRGYVGLPLFGKTQIWTRVVGRAAQ